MAASRTAQLPSDTTIPRAWPRRVVMLSLDDLAERAGIHWDEGEDELGPVRVAVIDTGKNSPRLALQRHEDAAEDGIVVFADERAPDAEVDAALTALGVEISEIEGVDSGDEESTTDVAMEEFAEVVRRLAEAEEGLQKLVRERQFRDVKPSNIAITGGRIEEGALSIDPTTRLLDVIEAQPDITVGEFDKALREVRIMDVETALRGLPVRGPTPTRGTPSRSGASSGSGKWASIKHRHEAKQRAEERRQEAKQRAEEERSRKSSTRSSSSRSSHSRPSGGKKNR